MSDSDDNAPNVTVKGKTEDGRTNYTQYLPRGFRSRQTCRKSTGGISPRVVNMSKFRRPPPTIPKKEGQENPKRAKLNDKDDNNGLEEVDSDEEVVEEEEDDGDENDSVSDDNEGDSDSELEISTTKVDDLGKSDDDNEDVGSDDDEEDDEVEPEEVITEGLPENEDKKPSN